VDTGPVQPPPSVRPPGKCAQRRPNGCLPSAAFLSLRELRSFLPSVPVLLMQVHSPLVSLYSLLYSSYSSSSQSFPQSSSPRPPSPATLPAKPSTIPPPHLVHPPTNEEIDAVIQQATSSVSSDGRHVPLKDTRTQLFVGNVRFFFVLSLSWPPSCLCTASFVFISPAWCITLLTISCPAFRFLP